MVAATESTRLTQFRQRLANFPIEALAGGARGIRNTAPSVSTAAAVSIQCPADHLFRVRAFFRNYQLAIARLLCGAARDKL